MKPYDFSKIDWALLRDQKKELLANSNMADGSPLTEAIDGIIELLDSIQDYAVDELGMSEMEVFGFILDDSTEGGENV